MEILKNLNLNKAAYARRAGLITLVAGAAYFAYEDNQSVNNHEPSPPTLDKVIQNPWVYVAQHELTLQGYLQKEECIDKRYWGDYPIADVIYEFSPTQSEQENTLTVHQWGVLQSYATDCSPVNDFTNQKVQLDCFLLPTGQYNPVKEGSYYCSTVNIFPVEN